MAKNFFGEAQHILMGHQMIDDPAPVRYDLMNSGTIAEEALCCITAVLILASTLGFNIIDSCL